MNVRTAPRMDKEAFFDWLAHQERRHELVDGVPVMLPWVTRNHSRIVSNVARVLLVELSPDLFQVSIGDFAVETGDRSIRFADVMVERAGGTGQDRSTTDALLLVEVLSPSTAQVDLGPKLDEYRALPRLGTYLVFAQDAPRVIAWTRTGSGAWPEAPGIVEGLGATVDLPVLRLALPLQAIYGSIVF